LLDGPFVPKELNIRLSLGIGVMFCGGYGS
jgi:hypothetical protein